MTADGVSRIAWACAEIEQGILELKSEGVIDEQHANAYLTLLNGFVSQIEGNMGIEVPDADQSSSPIEDLRAVNSKMDRAQAELNSGDLDGLGNTLNAIAERVDEYGKSN